MNILLPSPCLLPAALKCLNFLCEDDRKTKHPFSSSSSCLPRWIFLERFVQLWNLLPRRWPRSAVSPGSFFLRPISCPSLPGKCTEDEPRWHFWYLAHPLHEGWFLSNGLLMDIDIHQYQLSSFSDHVLAREHPAQKYQLRSVARKISHPKASFCHPHCVCLVWWRGFFQFYSAESGPEQVKELLYTIANNHVCSSVGTVWKTYLPN